MAHAYPLSQGDVSENRRAVHVNDALSHHFEETEMDQLRRASQQGFWAHNPEVGQALGEKLNGEW